MRFICEQTPTHSPNRTASIKILKPDHQPFAFIESLPFNLYVRVFGCGCVGVDVFGWVNSILIKLF